MKKKKIIYVITKSSWGGAQRYVYDLANHAKEIYEVVVIFGENSFGGESIFKNKLHTANIRTIEIEGLGRDIKITSDVWSFLEIIKIFKKEKPDIIHLNSTKIGGIGALAGRLVRVPQIVYTAHGLPFLEKYTYVKDILVRILSYSTFVLSHTVILLSEYEKALIHNWWFIGGKLEVIHNGITRPDFYTRRDARNKIGKIIGKNIDTDLCLLGSIAGLEDYKGLREFLPKIADLRIQNDFVYVHFGTGELLEQLKKDTIQLGLTDTVFWLGANPEAARFLRAFDLLTLPSKKEGFPYVLLEAAHADIPVYAYPVAGIPEMIDYKTEGVMFEELTTYKIKDIFALKTMFQKTFVIYNKNNHDF